MGQMYLYTDSFKYTYNKAFNGRLYIYTCFRCCNGNRTGPGQQDKEQSMYKNRTGIISLLAFCSLFPVSAGFPSPSFAATTTLNTPIKLTTHTADDFQPAVSPDGKM